MKIMICGSMIFSKFMIESKNKLEKAGHSVLLPCDIDLHLENTNFIDNFDEDYKHCIENQVMRKCFNQIVESDAILVLNYDKNGISGYIGTATLMEIGLAYHLGKKIFLLNKIPHPDKIRWAQEVRITQPIYLNGDILNILNLT